ncbi:polysaccharide deacetylase family protein [Aquisalimonas asiatica]|uniref:Polysaccharide deacetylase n=1 Tax=Aquisalimonas asiatica TaxID=406100 RepID=A0A1H8RGE6_9GAMM|nr:polysaccharide deacetylase family protein [Aquisalimonas asiatica]SEO65495.1 Polysaccharide deacetylase [Aquisalimonas asiatica]
MTRHRIGIGIAFLLVITFAAWWLFSDSGPAFPDLQGPEQPTVLPGEPPRTGVEAYASDHPFGVGLYVRDEESSWLGLAHGFRSLGIPFRVVTDLDDALEHAVIMVYPSLTGANTPPGTLEALTAHVEDGGTVVGFSALGGGARALFGYGGAHEHARRQHISLWSSAVTDPVLSTGGSSIVMLGSPLIPDSGLPGVHYTDTAEPPIAVFGDDGRVAVTRKTHGGEGEDRGHAYAVGVDLGHYILRAHNGRFPMLSDTYVNAFQPQVDTVLRVLKNIYREGDPAAITLSPTPHGREFTALMTHDVDFTHSMDNIPHYTEVAQRHGVPATYFIQTKYVTDYNDRAFFDTSRIPTLEALVEQGMGIASHTVAHSNELARMPVGSGTEQYPDYRPFVVDFMRVRDATMLGELRVSRFLLEESSGAPVRAFRPGHLSLPAQLPQLLHAVGYEFSSSITANEALTHLPYQLMHNRSYGAELPVYEFPVTIEDEVGVLGERFDDAVMLSEQVAQYQGLVNLLIHTDELGHKLDFVDRYMEQFGDRAWFDTVSGYGDWWRARESVQFELRSADPSRTTVALTVADPVEGLTLTLPGDWQYDAGVSGSRQSGRTLVLGPIEERAELQFRVSR